MQTLMHTTIHLQREIDAVFEGNKRWLPYPLLALSPSAKRRHIDANKTGTKRTAVVVYVCNPSISEMRLRWSTSRFTPSQSCPVSLLSVTHPFLCAPQQTPKRCLRRVAPNPHHMAPSPPLASDLGNCRRDQDRGVRGLCAEDVRDSMRSSRLHLPLPRMLRRDHEQQSLHEHFAV